MNLTRTRLAILLVLHATTFLALIGCRDDGVSFDARPIGLHGLIVGASSISLTNVNVHYIFYTSTNPIVQNVGIRYSLPTAQVVTLNVFDPFDRLVATLVSGQQPAGVHLIFVDSTLTNGVYSYRLQTLDSLRQGFFFMRTDDITQLEQRSPLLMSDQNGRFFLSPSSLGIGRTIGGEIILDSVSMILTKSSFRTLVETFRLDTTRAVDRTFAMQSN